MVERNKTVLLYARCARLISFCLALFLTMAVCARAEEQQFEPLEKSGPEGDAIKITELARQSIGLQLQSVTRAPLPMQISTPGKIEAIPSRQFAQHSPVSGRIASVRVNLGDFVKQGQVLLDLDSQDVNRLASEFLLSKQDIESQMLEQKTILNDEVNEAKARVRLADENYQRDKKLFDQQIGSEKAMQTSLANLEVERTKYAAAEDKRRIMLAALKTKLRLTLQALQQRLTLLGLSDEDIRQLLNQEKTIATVLVRSSRSGVVTEFNASPGQSIDPGVRLFTVADLDKVWATAQVYEDDMARIRIGQKVQVNVDALPGKHFMGSLCFIGSNVDPATRTLPVRAEIANSSRQLKPDMYARLSIQTAQPTMAMLLPHGAVVERTGHNLVFVETEAGFQPTRVNVGRSFGDNVEVLDGLTVGQKVAVKGAFQLAAEMLKASGRNELFTQVTEGEREDVTQEKEKQQPAESNIQLILVSILVAFVVGFIVSAVMGRARRVQKISEPGKTPSGVAPTKLEKP